MSKEEFVDDAKNRVIEIVSRRLRAHGVQGSIINVKLGETERLDDYPPQSAVIVTKDEKTGFIHLYVKARKSHNEVIEHLFGIEMPDCIGHVVIDNQEKSNKFFPIVKDFENILKSRLEGKSLFPEWENI